MAGRATVAGRPVYWLARRVVGELASGQRVIRYVSTEEVAVSRRTFEPVFVRTVANGKVVPDSRARVLAVETAASMPRSGGELRDELSTEALAPPSTFVAATRRMHAAPLVPAGRVAGLARTWVGQPRYYVWPFHGRFMGQGNPLAGVELYYGRLDATGYPRRTGAYVSITEFPRANAEVRFEGIGRFPSDGNAVVERGRATLRVGHLYVIVEASDARRALDAVRALLEQP